MMKRTIINHLAYLQNDGCAINGTHQSADHTKVYFMSCGCVVLAQTTAIGGKPEKYPLLQYRHHTTACKKHIVLRNSNLSFAALQTFAETHNFNISVNNKQYIFWHWLRDNYYTDRPIISEVDYNAIQCLRVDSAYTTVKHGTEDKLFFKRLT